MKYISSKKRAYTLLFAALTAAVVLGVAVFISSVSRKQYILASTARDSLFAIYNADSGIECASNKWEDLVPSSGDLTFYCNDNIYNVVFSGSLMASPPAGWGPSYESDGVVIPFGTPAFPKGCAVVTFTVAADGSKNKITSRGYNIGDNADCPVIGPRTVERAMSVTYE